jgi:menaquinone-specific isochorismate synthase
VTAAPEAAHLVARTRRLDGEADLLAVAGADGVLFEQAGSGIAGRGEALRLALPVGPGRLALAADEVAAALAAIECDDQVGLPGCGAVAFAALPFRDETPGSVIIPSVLVGRADDGTRWLTTVGPADHIGTPDLSLRPRPATSPTSYTITSSRPPDEWCEAVAAVVARIQAGHLEKAVFAREVVVEADAPIDVVDVLERLRAAYPSTMRYSVDGLVGATPELLVSRFGDVVRSHPFAGTTPRTGVPETDARAAAALLASAKEREEHQITIDMVLDAVLPFCSYVDSEPEPSIVSLANVQHLATLVEGRLSSPPASVLALVAALHPTPAICGWPTAAALDLIAELEGLDRGRYAGAVGWVDSDGDGRFGVTIRCAEIDGRRARLFAGMGIVADSDPATELTETRAKLQAMLGAVIRP